MNNAGGAPEAEAVTASPRFSEAIIRLNLIAPLHCAQQAGLAVEWAPKVRVNAARSA